MPNTVFVCFACGKMSNDQFGKSAISAGWDESCMLNSRECLKEGITIKDGRVVKVDDSAILPLPEVKLPSQEEQDKMQEEILRLAEQIVQQYGLK